jgi:hypothetical protein
MVFLEVLKLPEEGTFGNNKAPILKPDPEYMIGRNHSADVNDGTNLPVRIIACPGITNDVGEV